jgi:hypothetical protein
LRLSAATAIVDWRKSLVEASAEDKLTVLWVRSSLGEKASSGRKKKATGAEIIELRLEISELPDVFL